MKSIKANPYQPRKIFDENAIQELSDSIKEHGILQPIILRKTGTTYEIVVGERRFRAAKMAGLGSSSSCPYIDRRRNNGICDS